MLSLYIDPKEYERALAPLKNFPKELRGALWNSVKRSLDTAKKEIASGIKEHSYLKRSLINDSISKPQMYSTRRAGNKVTTSEAITGAVRVASRVLPLDSFKLSPKKITARKGIRSRNWKLSGYRIGPTEPVETHPGSPGYSPAFVIRGRKRGLRMFQRKLGSYYTDPDSGKRKQSVVRAMGYTVQYFAAFDRNVAMIHIKTKERFLSVLEHEVAFRLSRMSKGKK
jgi:hypothetical protein